MIAQAGQMPEEEPVDEMTELSMEQVIANMKEQGYSDISEREGDRYEIVAKNADGKKFELHVSAKTGEIVRKEQEDR